MNHPPFYQVENQMVSAERVLGYCKVAQEAKLQSEQGFKPADDWPAKGGIEVCTHAPNTRGSAQAGTASGDGLKRIFAEACLFSLLVSPSPLVLASK